MTFLRHATACFDRRICFVLPTDLDNFCRPEPKKLETYPPRRKISNILCFKTCPKSKTSTYHDAPGIDLFYRVGHDNPRIFSFSELYIGSNGFSDSEFLGSGGFGKVYKVTLPGDSTTVAVKCLVKRGERFEKTFAAELVAVAHLRHRNLVRLRGWCVHEDELLLVYDYMPHRSLDRVLFRKHDGDSEFLRWVQRRKIVSGLAAALYYLHEQLETQIIHRDVKASNVMLDSNYEARLGDFGLARWLEHDLESPTAPADSVRDNHFRLIETTRIGGTIGYLSPENFQKRSAGTAKSDVFSFGIVLLEIVSGRRAMDLRYQDDQIVLLDYVRRLSDKGNAVEARDTRLPEGSYRLADIEILIHLGLLCTLHDPRSRPNMKWVVEALSGCVIGKFPGLPLFQSHPTYISLTSQTHMTTTGNSTSAQSGNTSNTSSVTMTTTTSISSNYLTTAGETIYVTAESHIDGTATSSQHKIDKEKTRIPLVFPMVDSPREISYNEILLATNNFSDDHRVAEVDFGTAYRGVIRSCHRVLIKRLGMKTCPALRARFSNELQNLGRLRHRNLVQLRGWCTEQGEMLVVYDYLENRVLSHLLFHRRKEKNVLQWHHRYNIVKSLASAILYLHEQWEEQVIHRNITSSAITLDADMNSRLGSFALAEFLTRKEHEHRFVKSKDTSVRGIFGYMSPEYMESGEAKESADVYAFGVVVLEVVSGEMAVDFRRPEVLLVKRMREFEARGRPIKELADWRLNGEWDEKEVARLLKLGTACTCSRAVKRPSMRKIVSVLHGNDECLLERGQLGEKMADWKETNALSLTLVRGIQALLHPPSVLWALEASNHSRI